MYRNKLTSLELVRSLRVHILGTTHNVALNQQGWARQDKRTDISEKSDLFQKYWTSLEILWASCWLSRQTRENLLGSLCLAKAINTWTGKRWDNAISAEYHFKMSASHKDPLVDWGNVGGCVGRYFSTSGKSKQTKLVSVPSRGQSWRHFDTIPFGKVE